MRLALTSLFLLTAACSSAEPLGERTITVELMHEESTNWGPEDATGTATIDTTTGEVTLQVAGLPVLDVDVYEGWLAGGDEEPLSTGRFNVGEDGTGTSTMVVGSLVDTTYARVVLTVEPEPDPSPGPDPRHSIGGNIPLGSD